MDDMTTFEQLIAKAARLETGEPRPVDTQAIVRSATSTTSAPRWSITTRRLRGGITSAPARGGFQSMFSATKFVVAGVIVVLFGGFLLSGVLTTRQAEEPLPVGASASSDAAPVARVRRRLNSRYTVSSGDSPEKEEDP